MLLSGRLLRSFFLTSSLLFSVIFAAVLHHPKALIPRAPVVGSGTSAFKQPNVWDLGKHQGATRSVYVIVSQSMFDSVIDVRGGIANPIHLALHFGGTDKDRPLRYDLVREGTTTDKLMFQLSHFLQAVQDPVDGSTTSGRGTLDRVIKIGEIKTTNRGLTEWVANTSKKVRYMVKTSGKPFPVTLAYAYILQSVTDYLIRGYRNSPLIKNLLQGSAVWESTRITRPGSNTPRTPFPSDRLPIVRFGLFDKTGLTADGKVSGRMGFQMIHPTDRGQIAVRGAAYGWMPFDFRSSLMPMIPYRRADSILNDGTKISRTIFLPVFSTPEYQTRFPVVNLCSSKRPRPGRALFAREVCPRVTNSKIPEITDDAVRKAPIERTTVRVRGVITVLQAFDKVVGAASVAGIAAGPGFIIYDLSKGNYVGAAIQTAGFAVDTAIMVCSRTLMAAGIFGAISAPLLFFLPKFFEKKYPPGRSNNLTEIVSFKFFGDRTSRGNENCIKDRQDKGLDNDCTMLYGPGKIAETFGWEYYDGVAFVIAYNEGYHMSIEDIADAFHVVPVDPNFDDTTDKIATVECNKVMSPETEEEASHVLAPDAGFECKNAKFHIKRELITLPNINKTAAEIYPRIVTPRGGDCKPVVDPLDGSLLPNYNYTWIGMPAAIACNLTIPTLAQIGVSNGSTPTTTASLSTSTDVSGNSTGECADGLDAAGSWNSTSNSTDLPDDPFWTLLASNGTLDTLFTNTTDGPAVTNDTDPNSQPLDINGLLNANDNNATIDDLESGNSTASDGCLDPSQFAFLDSGPFNTLPAVFYSGNSSIVGNASAYISPGNASTDGTDGRGYVPVPPTAPFKYLDTTNAVCFTYPSHNFCLPNGSFTGVFTKNPGFDLRYFKDMTGPPGSSVTFKSRHNFDPSGTNNFEPDLTSASFKTNMTIKSEFDALSLAAADLWLDVEKGTMEVSIPTQYQAPSACLYSDVDFRGQIRCLGLGAGDLPSDFKNLTSSITTHGNATTYVFANRYGDASETKVGGPVRDLKGLLYSVNSSLNDLLVALWILDPTA